MTLTAQLPLAIRELHTRIEALPLAQDMGSGQISRERYCVLLGQMRLIHLSLEARLSAFEELGSLYNPSMARAADVSCDLCVLGGAGTARAMTATQHFLTELATTWHDDPAALVGILYVLEGSRMGSMVLAPALARGFGVPMTAGHGLDYHIRDMEGRGREWRQFKTALEALPQAQKHPQTVLAAAERTMSLLFELYDEVGQADLEEVASTPVEVGAAQ